MGWGSHPDTLTMAKAQREALAAGEPFTLAYRKAYRDAYANAASGGRNLQSYLEGLDRNIRKQELEESQPGTTLGG